MDKDLIRLSEDYRRLKRGKQPKSFKIRRSKTKKSGFILRKRLLSKLRSQIAIAFVQPFWRRVDYISVARKAFKIEPLSHRSLVKYRRV